MVLWDCGLATRLMHGGVLAASAQRQPPWTQFWDHMARRKESSGRGSALNLPERLRQAASSPHLKGLLNNSKV
jgi:hypothetical protein